MHEKFKTYLDQWVDPVKADLYLSALECLESYGFVNAWTELAPMLESATDQDVVSLLDDAARIIDAGLDTVLGEHSIIIDGEMRPKTLILRALKTLVEDERHEAILDILNTLEDPVEKLADLFELVDLEASNSWADVIDSFTVVPEGLMQRLKDIHEEAIDQTEPDADIVVSEEKRHRFQVLRNFLAKNITSLAAIAVTRDAVNVGLPLHMLQETYREELISYEGTQPPQVAVHLVGLVLLSDTPLAKVKQVSLDSIEDVYSDIDFITQVSKAMELTLEEVNLA